MMTRDLGKGCIGIANQDLYDACKMLIKDELTQKLDIYNGTKLKRMYKLTKIFTRWLTKIFTRYCLKND